MLVAYKVCLPCTFWVAFCLGFLSAGPTLSRYPKGFGKCLTT